MKEIKNLVIGIVIGALLGLWFGVNIGRERPLLSNPFKKRSIHEKFREAGRDFFDSASDAIKESSDNWRDKFKD
jgi:hypothetical protein